MDTPPAQANDTKQPNGGGGALLAAHQRLRRRAAGRFLGPRIAQRIFLGYVLPLSVLLAFGLVFPLFLWSYLGRAVYDYEERAVMADRAVALRRTALDAEAHARGFLRYHDKTFEEQFTEQRDVYRSRFRELSEFADRQQAPDVERALNAVAIRFRAWQRKAITRPFREAQMTERPGPDAAEAAHRSNEMFVPVRAALDDFVAAAAAHRDRQKPVARAADYLRRTTSVVIPLVAVVLSLLIGRSIALGITRPLEELIGATEQLEQGKAAKLLLERDPDPDDEIGDLQRAFRRMARTIQQREAVLRAQNEAVGALNRRIEAVLNATNDGILLIDGSGGFAVVSHRLAELFGLDAESLEDHTWVQAGPLLLSRFRNKATVRERFREILDDPDAVTDETFDVDGPGALRTLRVYSAPVRGHGEDDELLGRIFVFRDVTRETLVDRMKTEFVSTVSHELRTPLTAIKGYVDLMVSGQTGPLTAVQEEFLTLVQVSTRRLTTLINDMLDISRIESGRMEIRQESVEYLPLVQQSVRMMQQEADARNIALVVEVWGQGAPDGPFPPVSGDADRITQVLTNFLSNGIKYTPPGGSVTIRIEFEGNFVTTCIADTGIGIAPEDQRRLFQKFFRADNSTTREAGGTGLGLAITKAILEKLNGSVWVESDKGQGSRFWFTLPTVEAPAVAAAREDGTPPAASERKQTDSSVHRLILSIDGDVSLLHRLGHELRRQGFVTSNAANPADALRRARDLRPDLVTLDPLSPHLDGLAVLRTLQQNEATRGIPVALIAPAVAGGQTELLDTVAFLPREADDAEIKESLSAALNLRSQNGAAEEASGNGRSMALLLGEDDLEERLRLLLSQAAPGLQLATAKNGDEADRVTAGSEHLPGVIVLDTRRLPGTEAGLWVSRFRRRHPGARVPFVVLTEDDVCAGEVYSLVPMGSGPVPIAEMGRAIQDLLGRRPAPAKNQGVGLHARV
jgi:PAS domain S-box-containing protein